MTLRPLVRSPRIPRGAAASEDRLATTPASETASRIVSFNDAHPHPLNRSRENRVYYREWHQRVVFAEFAEAVGVPTTDVLDVRITPRPDAQDEVIVVYMVGPHDIDRTQVWEAQLERDSDGVFLVLGGDANDQAGSTS